MPGVEMLYFGDATQAAFMATVIGGFGALFGAIVFMLGARARRAAGVAAVAIFLVFAGFAYWLYLTPFYAVQVEGAELRLQKFYPSRTVALSRDEISSITRRNEVTKNSYIVTLVVKTTDGRHYESGQANPRQLNENFTRLEAWMAKK
jgi:hypothetical protein